MKKELEEAVDFIKRYREDKLEGRYNFLPLPFDRVSNRFPGLERGLYGIITANSGVGKTKVAKFLLVMSVMKFLEEHPNEDIHILWFGLEESKREFSLSFIACMMRMQYGIKISVDQLKSLGKYTLSEDILNKVEECKQYLQKFMANVTMIDNVYNPYGIWLEVRKFAAARGKFYNYKGEEVDANDNFGSKYVPHNPREFIIGVLDHVALLHPEKGKSLWETISDWSNKYTLNLIIKILNYTWFNIQQQKAEQEKQEYTFRGLSISQKLEPSLDGLGDCKITQRDADLVWGVFAPTRYNIDNYGGYNISPSSGGLGDNYRAIKFLKDRRFGCANLIMDCYFDGATNVLLELPKPSDMTEEKYKYYKNL